MNKFKWKAIQDDGITVYHGGENNRFTASIEYIGEDLHRNQMWNASLFDKESGRPIPVSEFDLPFTSVESAKEAIMRAIRRWEEQSNG